MQAKGRTVVAAAARERLAAAAAAAPPAKSSAGLQMHQQAAAAVETALDAALSAPSTSPPASHQASVHVSLLTQLMASSATALQLAARAARAARAAAVAVPDCWLPGAALAQKVGETLCKSAPLLAATCSSLDGLLPRERQALHQLVAAVAAYQASVGPTDALNGALEEVLPLLQASFLEAEAAVPGGAPATQAAGRSGGANLNVYDDELDAGGAAHAQHPG
jgi:hypothetical protein